MFKIVIVVDEMGTEKFSTNINVNNVQWITPYDVEGVTGYIGSIVCMMNGVVVFTRERPSEIMRLNS